MAEEKLSKPPIKVIRVYDARLSNERGKRTCTSHNIHLCDNNGVERPASDVAAEIALLRRMHRKENDEFRKEMERKDAAEEAICKAGTSLTYSDNIGLYLTPDTGNTTVILGSSKAGKSTLMMKIYKEYYFKKGYISFVYCESPQADVYKKWFVKKDKVNSNSAAKKMYNKKPIFVSKPEIRLESVVNSQHKVNIESENKFKFLNMIDDIIDLNTGSTNSQVLNRLMLTLRNSNISSIICLQYSNLMSKMARANVNNIYMTKFNSDEAIKVVVDTYLGSFITNLYGPLTDSEKIAWYREVTKNYSFIHVIPQECRIEFVRLEE